MINACEIPQLKGIRVLVMIIDLMGPHPTPDRYILTPLINGLGLEGVERPKIGWLQSFSLDSYVKCPIYILVLYIGCI